MLMRSKNGEKNKVKSEKENLIKIIHKCEDIINSSYDID